MGSYCFTGKWLAIANEDRTRISSSDEIIFIPKLSL